MTLTPLRQRFVQEYLVDLNPTAAAQRAGFRSKPEHTKGYQMLRIPEVAAAVREAMEARSRRTGITAERVLEELGKIGFSDVRNLTRWKARPARDGDAAGGPPAYDLWIRDSEELDDATAGAISEVRHYNGGGVRIRLHDKLCALALIARHLGMMGPRQDSAGPGGHGLDAVAMSRLTERFSRVSQQTRDRIRDSIREALEQDEAAAGLRGSGS